MFFWPTGESGSFAVGLSIDRDEILIDLNGEETLSSPTKRSLQIGEGRHAFGKEETVGYFLKPWLVTPNVFL